jgi:hypothetical protein
MREREKLASEMEKLRERMEEIERELGGPVAMDGHAEEQLA